MAVTNTLTYYGTAVIKAVKSSKVYHLVSILSIYISKSVTK
jgi:hypothetical protein